MSVIYIKLQMHMALTVERLREQSYFSKYLYDLLSKRIYEFLVGDRRLLCSSSSS